MSAVQKDLAHLFQMMVREYLKLQPTLDRRALQQAYFSSRETPTKHLIKLFDHFAARVEVTLRDSRSSSEYQELEKVLQSQEAEIRNHIRLEQQMKLYAESLQGKVDEADKKNKDLDRAYRDIVDKLRTANEELKKENVEVRREYDRILMECRALRQRNVSTLQPSFSTNKSRPYITLYQTQTSKKSPFKKPLNSSHSNLSKHHIQQQQNSYHKTLHDEHNKSQSKDTKFPSRVSSIHLFSKKNSVFMKPRK